MEENNSAIGIPDFPIFGMFDGENSDSPHEEETEERGYSNNEQQEQVHFLELMKNLMNEAQVSGVIFQDIMKAQHIARSEVAKAFYNILGKPNKL